MRAATALRSTLMRPSSMPRVTQSSPNPTTTPITAPDGAHLIADLQGGRQSLLRPGPLALRPDDEEVHERAEKQQRPEDA